MSRRAFKRVTDDNDVPTEPGTYRRVYDYWTEHCATKGLANTYWAEICCPGCTKVALLGSNHTVASDGMVSPSDVCPFPPCTFHEFIKLGRLAKTVNAQKITGMRRSDHEPPHIPRVRHPRRRRSRPT